MVNIKDVARAAGVSVSTVSRVINNSASVIPEKRQAVLAAMDNLKYQPNSLARALVNSRSDCIGLLVGEIDSPFFGQLMAGVHRVVMAAGKHVIVTAGYHQADQERSAIRFMQERRCDGLVIHSKALPDAEIIELIERGVPVTLVNRLIPGHEARSVYLDNEFGAYLATRHLIRNGHQNIAYVGTNIAIEDGQSRVAGYQRALSEAGIELDERKIVKAFPDEEGGNYAMSEVMARDLGITALFAYNDAMAAGAVMMLQDAGWDVPQQVSIVGFDDVILARIIKPHLTTIRYPVNEMGALAAQLVLHELDPRFEINEHPLRFTPRLIERQSVRNITD
ncbi:MAG: LacI family DNA-binding transcriptional regulator [Reinekea forsetii]|uniref:Galactose operon repressor, GalR-LacI family of transcriptional regulator n=1 Tax=Reinekea forsetii TaxID=1336806 RepID=A0A2K8KX90_9GAMM|nr:MULTISPECIES: LacI family DNA-binding transcriptional regulator [Reinekea]ATX77246.1 galactose operon repressor, GalR-LacI family of transcriptional regulator [Reinekea forsetii]MDO7646049.1 LacI family DNA-binding transcriptional regulator [Reinekea forsetii]MDO7675044.1 LacI family DNA-binding transcriptional regulator [Reinekea forsetii]